MPAVGTTQCGSNSTEATPSTEQPTSTVGTTTTANRAIIMIHVCRTKRRAGPCREPQEAGRRL